MSAVQTSEDEATRAFLKTLRLFSPCSDDELTHLLRRSRVVLLDPGGRLFEQGAVSDVFYVLRRGRVGVFHQHPEGRSLLVKLFSAPAVFGEMELFGGVPRQEFVQATTAAEVLCIHGDTFLALLRSNGSVCFEMLADLSHRFCISAYAERTLAFEPVLNRLCELLLTMTDAGATPHAQGWRLSGGSSYPALAARLGVTERSVERAVGVLLAEGTLVRHKGRLVVTSLAALTRRLQVDRLGYFAQTSRVDDDVSTYTDTGLA